MTAAVIIEGVSKSFGTHRAVSDLSLEEARARAAAIEQRHPMPTGDGVLDLLRAGETGPAEDEDVEGGARAAGDQCRSAEDRLARSEERGTRGGKGAAGDGGRGTFHEFAASGTQWNAPVRVRW